LNYLAHLLLAGPDPGLQLGGVFGDFIKGPLPGDMPAAIADGVVLHRAIDGFAERHPAFQRSRARLPTQYRRASGIAVDLIYDHLLASRWRHFHVLPLSAYTAAFYRLLLAHRAQWPAAAAPTFLHMSEHDWLAAYASPDAVPRALDRIAQRLRRPELLAGAGAALQADYAGFAEDFECFIDAAITFAAGRFPGP